MSSVRTWHCKGRNRRRTEPRLEPLEGRLVRAHLGIASPAAAAAVAVAGDSTQNNTILLDGADVDSGGNNLVHLLAGDYRNAEAGAGIAYHNLGSRAIFTFSGSSNSANFVFPAPASSVHFGTAMNQDVGLAGTPITLLVEADPGETEGEPVDLVLSYNALDPLGSNPGSAVEGSNQFQVGYSDRVGAPIQTLGSGSLRGSETSSNSVVIHTTIGAGVPLVVTGSASSDAPPANTEIIGGIVIIVNASLKSAPSPSIPPHVVSITAGHTRRKLNSIAVTFDEPMSATSSTDPGLYRVQAGVKRRGKVVYSRPLPVQSLHYDEVAHRVTLTLARPFVGRVQVTVLHGIANSDGTPSVEETWAVIQ